MATSESDLVKRIGEAPINYGLLKLIHHEVGNGLAVLSGYRQLLQQALSKQAPEAFSSTQDSWQSLKKRWSGYLQTMQDREVRLNALLIQIRELSPGATDERLCQNFVRADLVVLLEQVIEQRIPLYPECALRVGLPAQPLYIMCDPFWMQVLFEHVFLNYIIGRDANMLPAEIHLEPFPGSMGQEAKITLRIRSDLPELTPGKEREFEAMIQRLERAEENACLALCHEILHEHGGRIWSEQEGSLSLALPLAEEQTEM